MGELLKLETLQIFLVFVVPGFVAIKAHDLMVPSSLRNFSQSFIEVISYSMLNLALLFWAVDLLHSEGFAMEHPVWYYLGMFGVLFVAPIGLAIAAKAVRHPRALGRFLLQPTPTAWDFVFGNREHMWVLCHLKDGRMIGGIYSADSCTSAYPNQQDIYIEELWRVDSEGKFVKPIAQTKGALVRSDECCFIEFFKAEQENE